VGHFSITVGHAIYGPDNDSYMTADRENILEELTNIPICDKCGYRTDYRYNNVYFKLTRKTYEFSYTYDGVMIVSLRFKEFCDRNGYDNLRFIELERSFGFFQMCVTNNVVPYKATLKEKLCDKCGQYEEIIGPSIDEQKVHEPLKDQFYQSDLWFGSGNAKSPVLIVGEATKERLKKEKFKNIVFNKIEFEKRPTT
jgi:hypothetical protein